MARKRSTGSTAPAVVHHHPICHFINGERLHYLLLKVRTKLFDAGDSINEVLSDTTIGVDESSCAYYVFGSSDVIIRLWSTEKDLIGLCNVIQERVREVESIQVVLVDRMLTWYQQIIESQAGWHYGFDRDTVSKIADHQIPQLLTVATEPTNGKTTRFFIFIEETFAQRTHVFHKLHNDLLSGERDFLQNGMERISIYSYTTTDAPCVLIKGEVPNWADATNQLLLFAERMRRYPVKTTTFICAENIKLDKNALNARHRLAAFSDARKHEIIYNLLRSHECDYAKIRAIGGDLAEKRAQQFVAIASKRCAQFFGQQDEWWNWLGTMRLLFKWISFGDAGKAMRALGQEYIRMERDLVDFLKGPYRLIQEEKKRNAFWDLAKRHRIDPKVIDDVAAQVVRILRVESHLTLGSVPECLRALLKGREVSKEIRTVIEEFSKALDRGAENRNLLLHGREEERHFLQKGENAWIWEDYLENYLDVILRFFQIVDVSREFAETFVSEETTTQNDA
jgi:hypothetical protein